MHKIPCIALLCLVSGAAAQDGMGEKNALGWEHGLSYRRSVGKAMWVGCAITGNYHKSHEDGTGRLVTELNSIDSIGLDSSNAIHDTSLSYDCTIKIEAGKRLFQFKKLAIDAFGGVGYFYEMDKAWERSPNKYSATKPNNAILVLAGCEPSIMLFSRLSVGVQFGVQFTHTWRNFTEIIQTPGPLSMQTSTRTTTTYDNAFALIGNVALTDNLVVLFYF